MYFYQESAVRDLHRTLGSCVFVRRRLYKEGKIYKCNRVYTDSGVVKKSLHDVKTNLNSTASFLQVSSVRLNPITSQINHLGYSDRINVIVLCIIACMLTQMCNVNFHESHNNTCASSDNHNHLHHMHSYKHALLFEHLFKEKELNHLDIKENTFI